MSSITIDKRPTTPKSQPTRLHSHQKEPVKEDIRVHTSLPPSIEGPIYAILICHVPNLRWLPRYQYLCRSVTVNVTWWGEDETSAIFKPQTTDLSQDQRQQPSTTVKYYIRSDLQQFSRYLIDAVELVFKVCDAETNRTLGTVKVQNLSTLSVSNAIKGYHPIFSSKGDKLGELFVSLRIFLPGPQDSNENFPALIHTLDISNPPSRRSSIGANDYNQLENGFRTYALNRSFTDDQSNSVRSIDSNSTRKTNLKDAPPGMRKYKELPTDQVVDELIERANRLRENLVKSSSQKTSILKKSSNQSMESKLHPKKSHANKPENASRNLLIDDMDPFIDTESICDMLGLKPTTDSNNSIIADLDGLDNEPSLLDDLLYGGPVHISMEKKPSRNSRIAHLQSDSSDSDDTASQESVNIHKSDNENEIDDKDQLNSERLQLLTLIHAARLRIDHLHLNSKNASSINRTNKTKHPITYSIEYQFPVIVENAHHQITEGSEIVKITSKQLESNRHILFSHSSTYPCSFTATNLSTWSKSFLIFKIYTHTFNPSNPSQIGFSILPFEKLFQSNDFHFENDLNILDSTYLNHQQMIPDDIGKEFSIGQLHVMLEFDSNEKDFSQLLNRLQIRENFQSRKPTKIKPKSKKKSISKYCLTHENNEGLVVEIFFSVIEARNLSSSISNNNNLPPNPYFVCRAFWTDEPITSVICWGSSIPKFHFEQKTPFLLTKSMITKMHQNYLIIELWNKNLSQSSDQLIGLTQIPLEQFYISFKDSQISRVLLQAQYPIISNDSWLPIINPFNPKSNSLSGEIQVRLAMGTTDQILAFQKGQIDVPLPPSFVTKPISTKIDRSTPLIEHNFELIIDSLNNLRVFDSMIWGECDCFIQYSFPVQNANEEILHSNLFELQTIRTSTTLCTSNVNFHDINRFRYLLTPGDAIHKYFYAICRADTPMDASIEFEVWARFYHPNIRDQLLAKGKLPIVKLCSLTTMSDVDLTEKSLQSFRIPLEFVREDLEHKHEQYLPATTFAGDLLLTVTYKRMIVQQNQLDIQPEQTTNDYSQISISMNIIRACGLKYAAMVHARDDSRLNYYSQIGLNTYAKLTFSFLSDLESRRTKTISRSFIPEYNHQLIFPLSLIWKNHQNQSIPLIEMLEYGELYIEIFHQMEKNLDILLCHTKIFLKELIYRQTGIKGWYSLFHSDSDCVGGIELSIRFSEEIDRRKLFQSAKQFAWIDSYSQFDQKFLSNISSNQLDEQNLGCLFKLSIKQIQFPRHLLSQADDPERIHIFAQYRFYDKIPIITKRKQTSIKRTNCFCQLDFHKQHLFLYTLPLLNYIREEKFEIQIWTSENSIYDYSQSLPTVTEKFIGSIYIDLNVLLNSNEIHSILPIFKQGTKDLSEANVEIELSMEKSRDLKNDDFEHEYNHHNPHVLRQISNQYFSIVIHIEQAAHLPTIDSSTENLYSPPNSYVKFSTFDSHELHHTQVISSSSKPHWNYQGQVQLSIDYLFNEKTPFILQIFHCQNSSTINRQSDQLIGFVSIDLTPFLSGLDRIDGWYNIVNQNGKIQGQLKVNLIPKEDLRQFKQMKYRTKKISSTDSSRTKSPDSLSIVENDNSYLMNNLRRQLSDLDLLTERLKSRSDT